MIRSVILFSIILLSSVTNVSAESAGVIADFNEQKLETNFGTPFEVWLKGDGSDQTQSCQLSIDPSQDALGVEGGASIKIDYDVDSPNPAYNGVRAELNAFDASEFTHLNFYVKGDASTGFSPKFKVELIGSNKRPSPYFVQGITDSWQKISISFSDFFAVNDWTQLDKFVLVFADISNDTKTGTYYLDNVHFSKE